MHHPFNGRHRHLHDTGHLLLGLVRQRGVHHDGDVPRVAADRVLVKVRAVSAPPDRQLAGVQRVCRVRPSGGPGLPAGIEAADACGGAGTIAVAAVVAAGVQVSAAVDEQHAHAVCTKAADVALVAGVVVAALADVAWRPADVHDAERGLLLRVDTIKLVRTMPGSCCWVTYPVQWRGSAAGAARTAVVVAAAAGEERLDEAVRPRGRPAAAVRVRVRAGQELALVSRLCNGDVVGKLVSHVQSIGLFCIGKCL